MQFLPTDRVKTMLVSLALVCFAAAPASVLAQAGVEVLPEHPRISEVPSPAQFFGFELGSRHLRHDQVVDYLRELDKVSDRVSLISYARSHGDRPLLVVAITSAENTTQLEEIRRRRPSLTMGRERDEAIDPLLVMYMGYGVHGDEASAMNAAPLVAYHLASSQSEQVLDELARSVYLVDPALNPDGNDRFAHWVNANRGRFASELELDREHRQPWPGGRTNYYWFDLNRDWLPLVHPESRGRLRLFHQWKPNVVLDFHEMSGNSSYFFQPGVPERNNPLTPASTYEITRKFADYHARALDSAVELFFTEERFDDFYVGKGSTYPDLHGAIGILFEQGSTRGLDLTNDRATRSFADTIANHVRTSLSSLEAAAAIREEVIGHQHEFYKNALASGRSDDVTAYVLQGEASRVAAAQRLLKAHRIRCWQPAVDIRLDGEKLVRGSTLIIPTAQPEVMFLHSLMSTQQDFEEDVFYDVSTWHLPSAFDLVMHELKQDMPDTWSTKLPPSDDREPFPDADRLIGFAIDPVPLGTPRAIARLHRADVDVRVTTEPVTVDAEDGSRRLERGSFLILRQPNRERWDRVVRILQRTGERDGVFAQPLTTSMTVSGPDLGSDSVLRIPTCKPLLVVGSGTSAYTAGALWHFLDRRMGQPATVVDTGDFRRATLNEYTCVVMPAGSYGGWGDAEARQLRQYVESGGTIIGIGSAAEWLDRRGIISIADESAGGKSRSGSERAAEEENADDERADGDPMPKFGEARTRAALESIAGALFKATLDRSHPLAYGFPDKYVPVFKTNADRYPVPDNPYAVAARNIGVIAGYVSERNRTRLQDTAAVWAEPVGRGRVILLADNPVFRGYMRSTERFLTNALLLGPKLQIPSPPIDDPAQR